MKPELPSLQKKYTEKRIIKGRRAQDTELGELTVAAPEDGGDVRLGPHHPPERVHHTESDWLGRWLGKSVSLLRLSGFGVSWADTNGMQHPGQGLGEPGGPAPSPPGMVAVSG